MRYNSIVKGVFLSRPNRFVAKVNIDGAEKTVHVKNTGRCKEILVKGATVYLQKSDNPQRKTEYDLIAAEKVTEKGTILINIDSQIPNFVAMEYLPLSGLFSDNAVYRKEVTYKNSRFDIFVTDGERQAFIEVKGVTLERDGQVLFPDAPTQRGVKHINELINAKEEGFEAFIMFIVQLKSAKSFSPNRETHPQFACALSEAQQKGVKILCYGCDVTPDSIVISEKVPTKVD